MFNPRSFRYTGSPLSLASRSRPTVSPWPPDPSRQEPAVRARLDPVRRRPPADAGGRSTLHHRSPPHIPLLQRLRRWPPIRSSPPPDLLLLLRRGRPWTPRSRPRSGRSPRRRPSPRAASTSARASPGRRPSSPLCCSLTAACHNTHCRLMDTDLDCCHQSCQILTFPFPAP